MFSHVMVGVNDLEKSKQFYDAFLGALGVAPGMANKNRYFYRSAGGTLPFPHRSTARLPATAMARPSALRRSRPSRPTRPMLPPWQPAA
jgi:catechol 2,3-dioxygenase-like lactoylglutathione lyase family enzyme